MSYATDENLASLLQLSREFKKLGLIPGLSAGSPAGHSGLSGLGVWHPHTRLLCNFVVDVSVSS